MGSIAFHGPGGRLGLWVHDTAMLGVLTSITAANLADLAPGPLAASLVAGVGGAAAATVAVRPAAGFALQVGGGVTAAGSEVARLVTTGQIRRPARSLGPLLLLVAAAAVQELSRTGRPLCRPRSRLQGHAAWHLLSAAALYWWGRRRADLADSGAPPD